MDERGADGARGKEATVPGDFTVGDYLLTRLAGIGIRHLFGIPGDYNLAFLDHVLDGDQVTWVGNANELNAAYAADGYARVNGAGALLTTYGVGELSAINGIAGAYAEYLPVIHVVGAPATAAQRTGALNHHTLGDGDYGHFARAYAEVTVAQAYLSAGDAVAEIDRVLATSLREQRPGYLVLPTDVAASPAEKPAWPLLVPAPDVSARVLEEFTAAARKMLSGAGTLAVLADFLASRFDVEHQLAGLVAAGRIPHATLSMGKGLFDETGPGFAGTYAGAVSAKQTLAAVEGADVLISVGVRFTDTTTAGFSQHTDPSRTIDVQPFGSRIGTREFAPLPMRDAVAALTTVTGELGRPWARPDLVPQTGPYGETEELEAPPAATTGLGQAEFWPAIQRFLRPGDIVAAEQGTAFFGAQSLRLPAGVTFIGQPLWASIGYTLPAALGAQLAAPERRTVLLIGDGSALLTAQEIGTLLREDCRPVIIVINNDGYTVERAIHGPEQRYNDIPRWDWTLVPAAMGGAGARTVHASTLAEFTSALGAAADPVGLTLIETALPRLDVPDVLAATARTLAAANGSRHPVKEN
jgi:indolepyruvate decarboxylase